MGQDHVIGMRAGAVGDLEWYSAQHKVAALRQSFESANDRTIASAVDNGENVVCPERESHARGECSGEANRAANLELVIPAARVRAI